MKKERGFSLAEMMIILLIVSITTAATAPMINRKTQGEASEKSPWSWVNGQSVFYNKNGDIRQTLSFGTINKPDGENSRVYIDSPDTVPKIVFGNGINRNNVIRLFANSDHLLFTNTSAQNTPLTDSSNIGNAVVIGPNATMPVANSSDFLILGSNSSALSPGSIVIGNNSTAGTQAQLPQSSYLAIGSNTTASGNDSIAIGNGASVGGQNSIALGTSTVGQNNNSIAIGNSNITNGGSIVIGNYSATQSNSGVVAIGSNMPTNDNGNNNLPNGMNSVTIGSNALSRGANAVSIGNRANRMCQLGACDLHTFHTTAQENTVAIGDRAYTRDSSVAIGTNAAAMGISSIAIGNGAEANNITTNNQDNAIAIGSGAIASGNDDVVIGDYILFRRGNSVRHTLTLGTPEQTVYIPGNLVVGNTVASRDLYSERYLVTAGHDKAYARHGSENEFRRIDLKSATNADKHSLNSEVKGDDLYKNYVDNNAFSDRRLKNVGESFKAGLEEIKKLEVFHYTFKKDPAKTPRVGVMAQDLQKIFPDAVFKGEDGFLRIRMEDMFYAVVNSVKEINIRAIEQNKKITELNKQNKELKKRALKLKKRINKLAKNNINEDSIS